MDIRFADGGRARILQHGVRLAKLEEAPQDAEELLEAVACCAANYCNRRDIPTGMEWALSILLSRVMRGDGLRPVSSVKRGDTAITYGTEETAAATLLAPFVRLATPAEEEGLYE